MKRHAAAGQADHLQVRSLDDVLDKIESWSRAYPLDVFPKPDHKRAAEVLKAAGMTIDSLSADAMRHVITTVWTMLKPFRRPSDANVQEASFSTEGILMNYLVEAYAAGHADGLRKGRE